MQGRGAVGQCDRLSGQPGDADGRYAAGSEIWSMATALRNSTGGGWWGRPWRVSV